MTRSRTRRCGRHADGVVWMAAVVAGCWLAAAPAATAQPRYVVKDLGALDERRVSEGASINDAGVVVGASSPTGEFNFWGFEADGISIFPLSGGTLLSPASRAFANNATNQSAGWKRPGGGNVIAVRWTRGVGPVVLGTLPAHTQSQALGINAGGHVVGVSGPPFTGRAFLWPGAGPLQDLGTLGGNGGSALDINDHGQVVGWSHLVGDGSARATVWENGNIVNLGSGADFSYATAINNKGQIVGTSTGPVNERARLWERDEAGNITMTNLGTLGAGGNSVAYGINEQGVIVGEYFDVATDATRGFLWQLGTMYDLTGLLDSASTGWTVTKAQDINDAGQIAGQACHPDVGCHAVRLNPVYTGYLAEGATSATFFDTQLALLNPGDVATTAELTFTLVTGQVITHAVNVPARTRVTLDPKTVPGLEQAEFSTLVESERLLVVDRTMSWDVGTGYGSHAETAVAAPSPIWYLAEGATVGQFSLFYLLQNPSDHDVDVRVRYLRGAGEPLEKTYTVPATSRSNIWVNVEQFEGLGQALASAEISAVIESIDGTPIIVERAMYLSTQGRTFNAGHASAGVTAPALEWFLAEGATGDLFELFVLIANPNDEPAEVTVTYLLDNGTTYSRTLVAPPNARTNIWVDEEQFEGVAGLPLANVNVSTTVVATNDVPIIVERAMWWPGNSTTWHEAHNSAGSTTTGTRWALAEGEVGGPRATATFILIANTSPFAGSATVTLLFEDGTSAARTYELAPNSRTNAWIANDFPQADNRRFGAIVESTGATPAQIVVERAMYNSAAGVTWAGGTNALATRY